MSLLMWECGLKLLKSLILQPIKRVTPYVGVWIETKGIRISKRTGKVTPYVGVWIETPVRKTG